MSVNSNLDILDSILYEYAKENIDVYDILNESIFNEKKNEKLCCLPIDPKSCPKGYRIVCVNTHIGNTIGSIMQELFKTGLMLGVLKVRNPILVGLSLFGTAMNIIPLLSQWDARDFSLVRKDSYEQSYYNDNKILPVDIVACNDGIVESTFNHIRDDAKHIVQRTNAGGNDIIIDHGSYKSYYGHLRYNSIKVRPGDKVVKGQKIALMGDTGNSYCQHLHFSLNHGDPRNFGFMKLLNVFEPYKYTPIPWAKHSKELEDKINNVQDTAERLAQVLQYYYDKPLITDNSGYLDSFAYVS